MKHILASCIVLAILVVTQLAHAARQALVVGTSRYQTVWAPLPNATNDARALATVLAQRYGFHVEVLVDPSAAAFKSALATLSARATSDDDVFVFVAGHGHFDPVDKAGYLVFGDATQDCGAGCYPLDNVKRALFSCKARHVLVMLDACYAGTFDIRVALGGGPVDRGPPGTVTRLLADYDAHASRLMFASVGLATASDGAGSHSPFMVALLTQLAAPESGVVSLDRIYLGMREGAAPLPVIRPTSFEAERPHHPNGTFLFVESIDPCSSARGFIQAAAAGFASFTLAPPRKALWGSAWTVPGLFAGAARCEVIGWARDDSRELTCRFPPASSADADARFMGLRDLVAACVPEWSVTTSRDVLGATVVERINLVHTERRIVLVRHCEDACQLTATFR